MLFYKEIEIPQDYYGYIYITHDQKTNLKYVGHSIRRVENSKKYFGSGINISNIIKERGTYFLKKIILGFCYSEEELIDCETECKLFFNVLDPLYGYNIILEDYKFESLYNFKKILSLFSYSLTSIYDKNFIYIFNEILLLKNLNFNEKIFLSFIIRYNDFNKDYSFFLEKANFIFNITNVNLIIKKLIKEKYIKIVGKQKAVYITDKLRGLFKDFKKIEAIKINISILYDSNLTSIEKIVLAIIHNFYEKENGCCVNNKSFSNWLQVTEVYISNIVSSLIKKKKIEARYIYKGYMRDKRFITILKDEYVPDYQI